MKAAPKISLEAGGLNSLSKIIADLSNKRIHRGGTFHRKTPSSEAWDLKRDRVHCLIDRFDRRGIKLGDFNRSTTRPGLQEE